MVWRCRTRRSFVLVGSSVDGARARYKWSYRVCFFTKFSVALLHCHTIYLMYFIRVSSPTQAPVAASIVALPFPRRARVFRHKYMSTCVFVLGLGGRDHGINDGVLKEYYNIIGLTGTRLPGCTERAAFRGAVHVTEVFKRETQAMVKCLVVKIPHRLKWATSRPFYLSAVKAHFMLLGHGEVRGVESCYDWGGSNLDRFLPRIST